MNRPFHLENPMSMPKPKVPSANHASPSREDVPSPAGEGGASVTVPGAPVVTASEQGVAVDVSAPVDREKICMLAEVAYGKLGHGAVECAMRVRAEALNHALGAAGSSLNGWAGNPAPEWMREVIEEVEAHAFPAYAEKPGPEAGPEVRGYLKAAMQECCEAIWMHSDKSPDYAARYNRKFGNNGRLVPNWVESHPYFKELADGQADRSSLWTDRHEINMAAWDEWTDRVGEALCASLRSGAGAVNPNISLDGQGMPRAHSDLGGYPLFYIAADGGVLSPEAVTENLRLTNDPDDKQWFIVGVDVNYEDRDLICDETGKRIPCAYGDDEAPAGTEEA